MLFKEISLKKKNLNRHIETLTKLFNNVLPILRKLVKIWCFKLSELNQ